MTEGADLRALAFADRLASRCSDALGVTVVSVILHGSLTLDDFTPGRSDIDLLVVVEDPLSDHRLQLSGTHSIAYAKLLRIASIAIRHARNRRVADASPCDGGGLLAPRRGGP